MAEPTKKGPEAKDRRGDAPPEDAATAARTAKAPWVLVQTLTCPSVFHMAVELCGSM